MGGWRKRGKGIVMNEQFKELNIADVFTLRYERTAGGYYQQKYTPEEFDRMQEWLDRALGEYTQTMEVEANMLRARNERLQKLVDSIVPRLEAACGATAMPPLVIRKLIEELS